MRGKGGRKEEEEEEEGTHGIPSCINETFYAPAHGLKSICANARSTLRDAFDSLAGFGREILRRFTTEGDTHKKKSVIISLICLCKIALQGVEGERGREGAGTNIRDSIGLILQVAAIFDSGRDVEVDGTVFEYFDHFCCLRYV